MSLLRQCSKDGYVCLESIIETGVAICVSYMMWKAYIIISNDQSNILVKNDKLIYGIGMVQSFAALVYFVMDGGDFLYTTIKVTNIVTGALMCNILLTIVLEEAYYDIVWTSMKAFLAMVLLEWFWTAVVHKGLVIFNCYQTDYLMISITYFATTIVSVLCSHKGLNMMESFIQERRLSREEGDENMIRELEGRVTQIKLIAGSMLAIGLIQLMWDFNSKRSDPKECYYYFYAESIVGVVVFSFLKCLLMLGFPYTLYLVFFEQNRFKFFREGLMN